MVIDDVQPARDFNFAGRFEADLGNHRTERSSGATSLSLLPCRTTKFVVMLFRTSCATMGFCVYSPVAVGD